jgi:hypothetical protein
LDPAVSDGLDDFIARESSQRAERSAARRDPKLHAATAPAGYHLRGVSTLLDGAGNPVQQWIKTSKDYDPAAVVLELFKASLLDSPLPALKRVAAPKRTDKDLLAVYPMGDPHLGMLSWAPETGASFDLKIAERNLVRAVDHLVGLAPPAKQALIIDLGDFFHSDNADAVTARSGHHLDVDGRWAKTLQIGLRTFGRCIDRALLKHETVRVIVEIGNHDDHSSIMLALALAERYRNEPRVHIDTSPAAFHWHRFGSNLIGTTHGQRTKPAELPGVMAHDRPKDWGECRHRRFYIGHVHMQQRWEFPGCVVETFRTLAARDGWHAARYRSDRSMRMDVLDRKDGEVLSHTVGIERVER